MEKNSNYYTILMGDVNSSSNQDPIRLSRELKLLVNEVNSRFKNCILSPLTITLGDEFQSVIKSIPDGISILFHLEESILKLNLNFKLHYVLCVGRIDTEINPHIAHEMYGEGLTKTREMLISKKRDRKRFQFNLPEENFLNQLTRIFEVLDSIISSWKQVDYQLIVNMIDNDHNTEVGDKFGKNRDQIWKRRKTLKIKEYKLLRDFITIYSSEVHEH